ncbi:MAG TPA: CpsB/CapC family capsule biosynthesis tyrosine phosphatase [Bryobacteraceae bacterium]
MKGRRTHPARMIDIHTHILPGLDDGAASLSEAVEMVRIAARTGTTDLVVTPHANFEYEFEPAVARERLAELEFAAGPGVRLHWGCDFHLSAHNIEDALAHPAKYTINGKRYLLVEFPDVLIAATTTRDFARLLEAGMVPIITHPERNFLLHARMEDLKHWAGLGCLVQVTAQSFTNRFGKQVRAFARALLEQRLVHFVASDAHDAHDRTPRLDQAYREVTERAGGQRAELLFVTNPGAVLTGAPLPEPGPEEPRPARKWFHFRGC